jgi:hypothetical protein
LGDEDLLKGYSWPCSFSSAIKRFREDSAMIGKSVSARQDISNGSTPSLITFPRKANRGRFLGVLFLIYVLTLAAVSLHLYRQPIYDMDSIQYMGNALLMEQTDIASIHQRVYAELDRAVPKTARDGLLGHELGAPEDQNKSRQERAANPYRFGQFLPFFAVRPLYNQTLWLVSKTGLGLVSSAILISTASYFLMGVLLFAWLRRYKPPVLCLALSLLLMLSPPLTVLGRDTTSDALATLVAFASLYLIFEKRQLLPGFALLLASIYFRTDFVALAGPVLLACWLERRLDLWKAAVLSIVAVASVLTINHFAGDYGIQMLYYRNFVGTPVAPGETAVHFSFRDYLSAFRSGITLIEGSFFLPFLLLGVLGFVSGRLKALFAVTLAYVGLHFIVLPNWQERWVGVFYLSSLLCAATAIPAGPDAQTVGNDG